MSLDPLLDAGPVVRWHVASALLALFLGLVALLRRSRDRWHRVAGGLWLAAMVSAAGSAFLIRGGEISVLRALAAFLLWELGRGITHLWVGRAARHGRVMREAYATALVLAAVLSFLPGRRMSLMLFADAPWAGLALVAALGLGLAVAVLGRGPWRGRPTRPLAVPRTPRL